MQINKKWQSMLWVAGVMMLMSGHCVAVPGANCPKPEWPRDALRYELDGTTTLRYVVGADGRATSAVVEKSSGWKALDDAALNNLAGCVFKAPTPEGVTMPTQYVWRLDEERPLRPLLVQRQLSSFRSVCNV